MQDLTQQRKVTIMIAIIVALFFSMINQTIVGVALPRIIASLGGMDLYTWVITMFMLTSTISTILVGKLSDIYGRKPFMLAGIVFFMIGALFSGLSDSMIRLIIARGVQGIGAGIIMATAFTAIGDLFSPRERGKWAGLMSAVLGLSSILGPGLGGYIVDHLEWHWVFWIFLPLGVIAFFMILVLFPKVPRRKSESIDYLGSLFLVLTIVSMLVAFSWAGTKYAWGSPTVLGLFGGTIVALALFLFTETKVKTPVLPLNLFTNSIVAISIVIGFLMSGGMLGALMYIPFFVQGVMGVSATYAGYVTMPMSVGMFALSAYTGRQMTKTGKYKILAIIGMLVMAIGMGLMIFMSTIPVAVVSMVVFGVGLGLGMPVIMLAVQNAVNPKDLGVATSAIQLFRNLGGTIGMAVMGTIMATSISTRMKELAASNNTAIDPAVAHKLAQYLNPQLLLDKSKMVTIQNSLPPQMQEMFQKLVETLKDALAYSLSNVFLAGTILIVLALVLTFFLKEIPLHTWTVKVPEVSPVKEVEHDKEANVSSGDEHIGSGPQVQITPEPTVYMA